MKANYKFLFTLSMMLVTHWTSGCSPAVSGEVTSSPDKPSQILDTEWDDRSIFKAGLISAEQEILNNLPGASVYHIDFKISDDFLTLSGWEEVHYTNREEIPLNEVYFQLFPNAAGGKTTIVSLAVDGHEIEPIYEFLDSALLVSLSTPLEPGASSDIRMVFEVDVAREMEGNYGLFGYFDDVLVLDEFYPVIPVYDDEGWNVQAPPPNADTSYFDTSFYLVQVTAPADLIIAASGIEVENSKAGDSQVVVFAAGPVRDFYLAASEKFIITSQVVGETVVNNYVMKGQEKGAKLALQFTKNSLESFKKRFGAYPYTEFDVLGAPMQALGIEYPGIVGVVAAAYNQGEVISGLPFPAMLESVIAHEVAHQWFYNIVGNDQIDEPWLDEAMAQYSTLLYYIDTYGKSGAQSFRDSWDYRWERIERAEIPIGLPAAAYKGPEYSGIIYGRGPIFVEALASEMGKEAFAAFLKDYYETHKWNIATSDSFKETSESNCKCDLTPLFETWVFP